MRDTRFEDQFASALTPRQRQALILVANGLTDREIAARSGCSPGAARDRVRNAMVALGADSRPQAVALAMAAGLITAADVVRPVCVGAAA